MTRDIDTRGMSPFDVCILIRGMEGSQREIGELIHKSEAYVSAMQFIARRATPHVLAAWGEGALPFDLVREIVKEDHVVQDKLVNTYLEITRSGTKKSKGKARRELLSALKSA